jgi:hypothetical protein
MRGFFSNYTFGTEFLQDVSWGAPVFIFQIFNSGWHVPYSCIFWAGCGKGKNWFFFLFSNDLILGLGCFAGVSDYNMGRIAVGHYLQFCVGALSAILSWKWQESGISMLLIFSPSCGKNNGFKFHWFCGFKSMNLGTVCLLVLKFHPRLAYRVIWHGDLIENYLPLS